MYNTQWREKNSRTGGSPCAWRTIPLATANTRIWPNAGPANTIHWADAGWMLGRRRRRRVNIQPALGQCIVFDGEQCWSTVYDACPTLDQHWVNVTCFAVIYQSHLLTLLRADCRHGYITQVMLPFPPQGECKLLDFINNKYPCITYPVKTSTLWL